MTGSMGLKLRLRTPDMSNQSASALMIIIQIYNYQRKFRRNFRVTDIQQLFNHHSSYTTHQISWQVQQFVNLHVQISWQVQYKMRFREIADARNAVFFNRTGGFEPGKSSSAEQLLRDGLGSCSVGRPF